MKKTYKFRIYPSKTHEQRLNKALSQACGLYNQLLDIKQQIYLGEGESLSEYDLNNLAKDFDTLQLHSQTKQNIASRITEAYKHFFRRVKNGDEPGFPKFKSWKFYQSITFPQYRQKVKGNKLYVSKVGMVPIVLHREIEGQIKTLTIKKENTEWYATFSCDACPVVEQAIDFVSEVEGLDVGLSKFLVSSDVRELSNPRWLRESESTLVKLQRRLSKKKRGSKNRLKAKLKVAKLHQTITRQREDFHKKLARKLAMQIKYIGIEDLNVQGMVKNHCLAKSISDVGWGSFFAYLKYYKTIFDGDVIEIGRFEPTSQTCSKCGHRQDMPLKERTFVCGNCHVRIDRDLNAALNIKRLTISKLRESGIEFTNDTVGHAEISTPEEIPPLCSHSECESGITESGTKRVEVVVVCHQ